MHPTCARGFSRCEIKVLLKLKTLRKNIIDNSYWCSQLHDGAASIRGKHNRAVKTLQRKTNNNRVKAYKIQN